MRGAGRPAVAFLSTAGTLARATHSLAVGGADVTEHAQAPDWTANPTLNASAVPVGDGDWVSLNPVINFLVANGDSQDGALKGAARALFSLAERGAAV